MSGPVSKGTSKREAAVIELKQRRKGEKIFETLISGKIFRDSLHEFIEPMVKELAKHAYCVSIGEYSSLKLEFDREITAIEVKRLFDKSGLKLGKSEVNGANLIFKYTTALADKTYSKKKKASS